MLQHLAARIRQRNADGDGGGDEDEDGDGGPQILVGDDCEVSLCSVL